MDQVYLDQDWNEQSTAGYQVILYCAGIQEVDSAMLELAVHIVPLGSSVGLP